MKKTHCYKFEIYHKDGNTGNRILFCLSDDDIIEYKMNFMKQDSVERVEVYRQYVSYELVNV